jgi:hypothetical protein
MYNRSRLSTGASDSTQTAGGKRSDNRSGCCDIDIHIDSRGDVNIYNCSTPSVIEIRHRRRSARPAFLLPALVSQSPQAPSTS